MGTARWKGWRLTRSVFAAENTLALESGWRSKAVGSKGYFRIAGDPCVTRAFSSNILPSQPSPGPDGERDHASNPH